MHQSTLFLSVLLACLFGLSQQTEPLAGSGGGGGGGGVTFEDDEDLADGSGSGSGSGDGSGMGIDENAILTTCIATINISSQVFTPELADSTSQLFMATAKQIRQDLEDLFRHLPGEQTVVILGFSKGSLMTTFELQDSGNSHPGKLMKVMLNTLAKGKLGNNTVSMKGFVFKQVETATTAPKMTPTPTTTATKRPLTMCMRMREMRKRLTGSKFLPRCAPNGDFESLQCREHAGMNDCWCSDLEGVEIPGTRMEAPNFPDCDDGYNMSPCVHQLVTRVRSHMLGTFRPKCALDGQYERIQCHGSVCFCVDEDTGKAEDGTEVYIPATPNCDDEPTPPVETEIPETEIPKTDEPKTIPPAINRFDKSSEEDKDKSIEITREPEIDFPGEGTETIAVEGGESSQGGDNTHININININKEEVDIDGDDNDKDDDDEDDKDHEDNKTGNDANGDQILKSGNTETRSRVKENQILTQPGLLGGIIGGAVVLLLGLVLLTMFIVYRMRKKDEGSYPLDEPRKAPNYSYVRAPEKEYYA